MTISPAACNRVPFTAIPWILNEMQARKDLHPARHDLRRSIPRAIVDHQNLGIPSLRVDAGHYPV
jgi:hypothetical protein